MLPFKSKGRKKKLRPRSAGSSARFHGGLPLTGRGPPTSRRAICFTPSASLSMMVPSENTLTETPAISS